MKIYNHLLSAESILNSHKTESDVETGDRNNHSIPKNALNNIVFFNTYNSIADFYYAFKNNEIALFYQPRLNISNHNIISLELFSRWKHPEQGFVSPLNFIHQPEFKRNILAFSNFTLQNGFKQLQAWQQMGLNPLSISINIYPEQFYDSEIVNHIYRNLEKFNLNPEYIEIEIPKSIVLFNLIETKDIINNLRSLGVKIQIDDLDLDDLRCEISSIKTLLSDVSVNGIKIAPSLIQNLKPNSYEYKNLKSLLSVVRNFNIEATILGVSTHEHLELTKSLGCYLVQGSLFDPALALEDMTDVLNANWFGRVQ